MDIVLLANSRDGSKITWYENTDGRGVFGAPSTIVELASDDQRSMFIGDLDADGDKDVLVASSDAITWHDNLDGLGNFSTAKVIRSDSGANEVVAGDLDGDGDLDVLLKDDSTDTIGWLENSDGTGSFGEVQTITNDLWQTRSSSVSLADLDMDGDLDVMTMEGWHENTDGRGNFGPVQHSSDTHTRTADLDGDGDLDALSIEKGFGEITWRQNVDGEGTFEVERTITRDFDGVANYVTADLDGDGDVDLLFSASHWWTNNQDKIAWLENDGSASFGPEKLVTANREQE